MGKAMLGSHDQLKATHFIPLTDIIGHFHTHNNLIMTDYIYIFE